MARNHCGFLVLTSIIGVLLTAAACSASDAPAGGTGAAAGTATAAATVRTSPAAAAAATPAKRIDVLSASFVSPSRGWVLAELPCNQANACPTTVLMRETVNGGRTWSAMPAPPAPPADMLASSQPRSGVGQVLFTSARDGWAFGPDLWRTTDGGATWRRVRAPGPVADFTVAGGRMLAVTSRCGSAGACAIRGYAAPVRTGAWQPVPGTATTGASGSLPSVQLAISGSAGYLLTISPGKTTPVLLTGLVTGAARWHPLSLPRHCTGAFSGALAAAGGRLFLGCGSEPGAGNQLKTAYRSQDGGRTWRQVAGPPSGGYLGTAIMSPGGTVFLSGGRMNVYISGNRGGTWQQSPSLATAAGLAGAGFPLLATTISGTFGVLIQQGVDTEQVWLTRDAGRHWTPATVH